MRILDTIIVFQCDVFSERGNPPDTQMAECNSRGVSPIIGIVLLIGITTLLAATLAVFALGLDTPTEPDLRQSLESDSATPDAAFDFSTLRGLTTVTHNGGDDLVADRVTIETDDGPQVWADSGRIEEGDSRTVSGSGVRVLYEGEVIGESGK